MARHRAPLRPRYGRISALGAALLVTLVAVLGGTGVLPDGPAGPGSEHAEQASAPAAGDGGRAVREPATAPRPARRTPPSTPRPVPPSSSADTTLPPASGEGRRVVYSESRQRVWLVEDADRRRAHLPGLRHRLRQPRPGHLRGLLPLRGRRRHRRLRHHEVVRALHPGPLRRGHRLPRHPGQGRRAAAEPWTSSARRPRTGASVSGDPTPALLWDFAPLGTTVVVTR